MALRHFAATLAALLTLAHGAIAQTLHVGSPAPKLEQVDWLKGEPVNSWESGHIYVLDFWATWCSPCIIGIPHLNQMQKDLGPKNVHVVGVAIWPMPDQKPTAEFVKEQGANMSYRVAEDRDMKTANAYMAAARINGIPTAMVVDQKGRIAWIGHPQAGLDDVVKGLLDGTYDVDEKAKEAEQRAALEARVEPLLIEIDRLASSGKIEEALAKLDEVIVLGYDSVRLTLTKAHAMMTMLNDPDGAYAFLTKMSDGHFKSDSDALNDISWFILDTSGLPKRDLELAQKFAERANTLTNGKDPSVMDTLARAYFMRGEVDKAIELQNKAIALADGELKALLETHLMEYTATKDRAR